LININLPSTMQRFWAIAIGPKSLYLAAPLASKTPDGGVP